MTNNELVGIIQSHWALLWPLPTRERMLKLEEIKADYDYENQLRNVEKEMADV